MDLTLGIGLGPLAKPFSPLSLFAAGEQGAWYDPSDFTTMFQDSAGSTPVTAVGQSVGRILDKSGRGNHASQATAASRPILGRHPASGTRNLAHGSAAPSDTSVWPASATQNGITATKVGSGVDSDGLPYVDVRYQGTQSGGYANNATYTITRGRNPVSPGQVYTVSAFMRLTGGSAANCSLTLGVVEETAPTTYVAGAWSGSATSVEQRLTASRTIASGNQVRLEVLFTAQTGATVDATYRIKGLQLELGSTATTYQANASAYDVTEAGIPDIYYLAFDGVDDFLVTNTVTPGTDKAQIFAGVRKLSDAGSAIITETSVDASSNLGVVGISGPPAAVPGYGSRSKGSLDKTASATVGFASPITNVVSMMGDIANDSLSLRANGVEIANNTGDQGTGNFLAYPIYIGRRGGSSLPFNGRIYSLIVRFGANLTAGQISNTERAVNSKTGAY